MPASKNRWVKKTLGACLAFSFSTLTLNALFPTPTAYAHAEHGTEGGIPTVSSKAKLPKGISLQVLKTNAYQFALATDGKQQIEILGEDKRPFLRFDGDLLYGDLNSTGWHRSRQPGGGPLPDRLKTGEKQKPNWILLEKQAGFGWYDPRLMNEELPHFQLEMKANGKPLRIRIERVEPEPMQGYWRPFLTGDTELEGLNAMVPGLSGNALMVGRLATAQQEFQVLDEANRPFLELREDGTWIDSGHPWAPTLDLFYTPANSADSSWVKVSEAGTVTYADPRLGKKPAKPTATARWEIPVRTKGSASISKLTGELQWQRITSSK